MAVKKMNADLKIYCTFCAKHEYLLQRHKYVESPSALVLIFKTRALR